MQKNYRGIDWGDEMSKAVKTGGKTILKVIGYIFNVLMTVCLVGAITATVVGITFLIYIKNYVNTSVDDFELLVSDKSLTTMVAYEDKLGNVVEMESERLSSTENRVWVSYSDFNKYIGEAFKAVEDKRFDTHHGVDWYRLGGVAIMFATGRSMQGGSTITQQLIKNVTGNDEVTLQRKIGEIFQALNLEKKYDKTEILEMYLNSIYLSEGCYGIGAAAYTYFGKEVKDLTLIESAAIAGITQNPYQYDPILHPQANAKRRNIVLSLMYEQGKITQEEFASAYEKDLVLNIGGQEDDEIPASVHSWYTDAAQQEATKMLVEKFGYTSVVAEKALLTGGYTIVTAQDPEIQKIVEDYYISDSSFQKVDKSPVQPESGFVIIDPSNGNVVALVGGRGKKTANLLLNYATQTKRPPGSSFKPISVYAPSFEAGLITYGSVFDDAPLDFGRQSIDSETGNIVYSNKHGYPANLPDSYAGLTTVHDAVRVSKNTVACRVLQKLGFDSSYSFLTEKVGISTLVDGTVTSSGKVFSDKAIAPLAMGQLTYGVTVREMTAAFQIFANNGVFNEERIVLRILDQEGNVVIENEKKSSIVMSEQNASIMTRILQSVVSSGTATSISLKSKIDVAGKTGTSQNAQDYWFIGYTPYYVAGVWFGYSMPRSMSKYSSSKTTLAAWDAIMTKVHQKYINSGETPEKFALAPGIINVKYCKDSGCLATDACRADPRGSREENGFFVDGTEPTTYCAVHMMVEYDAGTGKIATDGCKKAGANIKKVGLLNVFRSMPYNIKIADASYTAQVLPAGYSFEGLDGSVPYYQNMLSKGMFTGRSSKISTSKSYNFYKGNSVCTEHLHFTTDPEPPETEGTGE